MSHWYQIRISITIKHNFIFMVLVRLCFGYLSQLMGQCLGPLTESKINKMDNKYNSLNFKKITNKTPRA